jgi:hypothetical protein
VGDHGPSPGKIKIGKDGGVGFSSPTLVAVELRQGWGTHSFWACQG